MGKFERNGRQGAAKAHTYKMEQQPQPQQLLFTDLPSILQENVLLRLHSPEYARRACRNLRSLLDIESGEEHRRQLLVSGWLANREDNLEYYVYRAVCLNSVAGLQALLEKTKGTTVGSGSYAVEVATVTVYAQKALLMAAKRGTAALEMVAYLLQARDSNGDLLLTETSQIADAAAAAAKEGSVEVADHMLCTVAFDEGVFEIFMEGAAEFDNVALTEYLLHATYESTRVLVRSHALSFAVSCASHGSINSLLLLLRATDADGNNLVPDPDFVFFQAQSRIWGTLLGVTDGSGAALYDSVFASKLSLFIANMKQQNKDIALMSLINNAVDYAGAPFFKQLFKTTHFLMRRLSGTCI